MNDEIMKWFRKPFLYETEETVEVRLDTNIQYFIGKLLSCHWCTSMWVAGGLTLLHYMNPNMFTIVSVIASLSAISSVISLLVDALYEKTIR